ncbi:hypothetical protein A3H80_01075 [Candidatus Roizmanbacteria bacterium RIFCSPLOWO2_02_FULL_37_19]|uniref:CBS domain-containing protein n=1 Tax=Candidatus Roizmanbacteria bacterium RIFCSPHIGHO2_02_FULL_37_24 TaxID=1802037 RepID=A0A1F7GTW3_9BACT|nr:MAG: hypothetical protein A2862_03220 [Candidatus Roizmanbacteria bacterium RIFCSPHIGHO2_01_FULL_38_41]OGK22529.1 MAG: hypothetical protein A3C24_05195 [Candidatus Roizmanbacteria bacterium RIFCSPHIGHO2_02_FULL_37_24]OGK33929.1 MAG: hypothetical protein A3E10_01980 [Candidatus Roizmanbacteria bacterium RIFCSPHIGHO2_12_FULL_37_23]OGK43413.1 MAG: hypothetical protein A2956_04460 [Candidatus Roizmanbacteria bacterium RIFCSPLOWO2_01_FULL_37_57]OGK54192.1 MAG: hypothetical protein A3H80_01075 [Ca
MKVRDFVKTDNIIKISPQESLTSALGLLSSSHDAAFIFQDDEFLGVINPYFCLIKKSYPAHTHINTALVKPPRVKGSDSLEEAARLMMESKIHYLPVFENDIFIGIISARRILSCIKDDERFQMSIGDFSGNRNFITIHEDDYVSKAMSLFKDYKISKLVVISPTRKLLGVLTYYDVINYVSVPRERQNYASREGNKDAIMQKAVKNFYKHNVLTLTKQDTLFDVIKLILDKQIGSVVIIEPKMKPVGIVTTKDILKIFVGKPIFAPFELYTRNLSQTSAQMVGAFSQRLGSILNIRKGVRKAELTITEKKQGGVFEGVLSIFQKGKQMQIVRIETKDLKKLLKDLKRRGKRLLSR